MGERIVVGRRWKKEVVGMIVAVVAGRREGVGSSLLREGRWFEEEGRIVVEVRLRRRGEEDNNQTFRLSSLTTQFCRYFFPFP